MADNTTAQPGGSTPAFLFRCGNSNMCAVTLYETGGNLPKDECEDGWHLLQGFALGVQEPVPASVNPENVIVGIEVRGFYLWHDMSVSRMKLRR